MCRSSRGEAAGGLRDGEKHRTRRKETASWADEMENRPETDQKTYPTTFESEIDGGQSSRRDDGRGGSQYSRQDRRKSQNLLT